MLIASDKLLGQLEDASKELSDFVMDSAVMTAARLGFGWQPVKNAPSSFPTLRVAYQFSVMTGRALPVSNENSSSVIFTSPEVNFANRFWHDVNHVQRGCTFSLPDELRLSSLLLDDMVSAGFERGGLAWRMLHADTAGQIYHLAIHGDFPVDQRQFILDAVLLGLDRALYEVQLDVVHEAEAS